MRLLPPVRLVLAAGLCLAAAPAHAQWARHQGGECHPMSPAYQATHATTGLGSTNTNPAATIWLACRSDDTEAYPDSAVNAVRLYVHDASPTDGFTIRACVSRRETEAGQCSAAYTTSAAFVGGTVITILGNGLDLWKDSTDFSYLQVEVPAKAGGNGFSYLKGWVTEH